MREIRMSGSMRGMWKRGYGQVTWAPPDERGGQQTNQTYYYRATSLLYRDGALLNLAFFVPIGLDKLHVATGAGASNFNIHASTIR